MVTLNLTYTTITKENIRDVDSVKELYFSSFPEEERRPWDNILQLIESEAPFYKFVIVTDESGCTVGFYSLWRLPQAFYIEHLAVKPEFRNLGIASEILSHAKSQAETFPVIVEVEPADTSEQAVKRISFYERNGFIPLPDVPYIQPPYSKGLPEVPLMLMTTTPIDDIDFLILQLHTLVYNK